MKEVLVSALSATMLALICFTLSTYTLRTFLSFQRTPFYVYICSWMGYFLSISVIFLVPLDVAVTSYLACDAAYQNHSLTNVTGLLWTDPAINGTKNMTLSPCDRPFNFIPPGDLEILWNCIYWSSYVATWVIFPLLQSFVVSGEFTVGARIKAAIKENLILGLVAVAVCFVMWLIIFFAFNRQSNAIIQAVITAGGMWGITVLVCLLGYGIVFVPRKYWRMGDRHTSLLRLQTSLTGLLDDVEDYGFVLEDTLKVVKKYDAAISDNDPLRVYMDKIISHVPTEYGAIKTESEEEITLELTSLVSLHERLMWDSHRYATAVILFGETFKEAVALDDVINARKSGWKKRIKYSLEEPPTGFFATAQTELDWIWSLISPFWFRAVAVLFLLMSLTLLYSEMIFFHFPDYSFWAFVIYLCRDNSLLLQGVCLGVLAYIGSCCYSALFQLKLFSFYQLVPHQQTDENSILFSAAYLSRLVAPIALNFLHVIKFASTTVTSPFMKMVSVVSKDPIQEALYAYIPLFLLLIAIATIFNLGNRFMSCIGLAQVCCSDDFDETAIDQGRDIMEREKDARLRGGTTLRGVARSLQNSVPRRRNSTSAASTKNNDGEKDGKDPLDDMIKEVTVQKEPNFLQKGFTWVGSLMGNLNTEDNNRRPRRLSSSSDIQFTLRETGVSSDSDSNYSRRANNRAASEGKSGSNPFDNLSWNQNSGSKPSWEEDDTAVQLAPRKKYAWESSSDEL